MDTQQQAQAGPYQNHTEAMLLDLADEHELRIASSNVVLTAIREEITRRYRASVEAEYDKRNKSHGDVTVDVAGQPGLQLKGKIGKTVKWDSAKLQALASSVMLPREQGGLGWTFAQVQKFFKIEFSVPEKSMPVAEAAFTEEQRKTLIDARTVKFGDLAVQLVRNSEGQ